ncbi:Small ribosomal subunit biogenesis GTPase RsgA [Vibrio sp. B1FLJ16]|uniref:ribosome small subunit-dependent GTPase A n=1 Tax=Vibrio sp. B1FLJ16 TaxID=2751178 RepID=UPI0015F71ED0|nr:ribosome small subunit-dependent GTPase A [Vibrio sp. B1FLJ16]CAD7823923.1 Small ribosomal subunit biogenesis GTPase RsgA [Vibrio sp. B1FLJ16]CAE6953140.1 Small ribosomal subunit biogenesis GTPase RsgA [Vibrio sp. B1FLJ16]
MNKTHTFFETLTSTENPLKRLGWKPYFQQQLTLDDYEDTQFARVIAHHRSGYVLAGESGQIHLNAHSSLPSMTVGDWVILDNNQQFLRLLERRSLFTRKAAGDKVAEQLIAANVDTVFIVCSLNHDFNLSRIERYLALVHEAEVEPVIVLSKADLCDNADELKSQVQKLDQLLVIETVNGLEAHSVAKLMSWCNEGQTVAFIGSSGVGKSTLINALLGQQEQATSHIREDDSKGRHTTTSRSIHILPSGGLLMDTPGMREIQLADCETGVSETFSDITELAEHCHFSDCQHVSEPGCEVQAAIEDGRLELRRLNNYQKLLREQAINGATLAEKRDKDKQFGKMVRSVMSEKRKRQQSY